MKLSEQIRPHSQYWDCYNDEPLVYDHTNKLVKIAENFAIDFAEWILRQPLKILSQGEYWDTFFEKRITTKELLEIYKKEKGL